MELFILLLFGHLLGDYLFQNDWMARQKKEKLIPCMIHCIIYTLTVFILLIPLLWHKHPFVSVAIIICIFLSHIILDATHLIDRWFRFTRGRSWTRLEAFRANKDMEMEKIARVVYTALVQTVADNTIHLILMYFLCYVLL